MPDLDKILKMSEIFGVSTDTLLKRRNGVEREEKQHLKIYRMNR
mgnify:CR=1 FL=1